MDTPGAPPPIEPSSGLPGWTRVVVRTALLALAMLLLFPELLGGAGGAWARWVNALGGWRWAAWAACFVVLMVMRVDAMARRT